MSDITIILPRFSKILIERMVTFIFIIFVCYFLFNYITKLSIYKLCKYLLGNAKQNCNKMFVAAYIYNLIKTVDMLPSNLEIIFNNFKKTKYRTR